jgi:hypothetical protein
MVICPEEPVEGVEADDIVGMLCGVMIGSNVLCVVVDIEDLNRIKAIQFYRSYIGYRFIE